jgi:phosphatidylserine/phosphatidylglycerophosphate/cardiolipin synthase-like enzyme
MATFATIRPNKSGILGSFNVVRSNLQIVATAGLVLALGLGASGCKGLSSLSVGSSPGPASNRPVPGSAVTASGGALTVLAEPPAGLSRLYALISSARSSVDLTMYELKDPTAEADLIADAHRGVDVRVILDRHLEGKRNQATFSYLRAHHVHVAWAPVAVTYHQKTLTVDDKTSVVMTLNMVSSDYAGTRDFAVIDTGRADVAAVVATFNDAAFRKLVSAGAHVSTYADSSSVIYIHAKAIVADSGLSDQRVFVGSENFSAASLRHNRELGIVTTQHAVVAAISAVLASDFAGATPQAAS